MSNQLMHPSLSQLLPLDKIPNELEALKDALSGVFDSIFIKNLIASQSYDGSSGFYSMVITTYKQLGLNIPIAQDLKLVLNPTSTGTTEIGVSFNYSWYIVKYIQEFNFESFDYAARSLLDILFELAGNTPIELLSDVMSIFFPLGAFEGFTGRFNDVYGQSLNILEDGLATDEENIHSILKQIDDLGYDILDVVYKMVLDTPNGLDNVKKLFGGYFSNIEQNLKEALTLNFNAQIKDISIGLQFPRKWLVPVYTGVEPNISGLGLDDPLPDGYFSYLTYDVGSFSYSSKKGFIFNSIQNLSLTRSMIGNTGLIAEFSGLKIDLNKDHNILEADLDGRPGNFMGVYAEHAAITLPKKWFSTNNNQPTTLEIKGSNLLIGTGGISGTIGLYAVNGAVIGTNDYLWKKIGGDNGFELGFNAFDITFKQNVVTKSNIKGALRIPKFKTKGSSEPLEIGVAGHLSHNGDFNLTASFAAGIEASLFSFINFNFLTVELGKSGDKYYIGTSCEISFPENSPMYKIIKTDKKIILPNFRIYSDGSMELVGGSTAIPTNVSLHLGPVDISVTNIQFGAYENDQGKKYNYFSFDGAMNLNPLGIDGRGKGLRYYYAVDGSDSFIHVSTIEVDIVIPGNASAETAAVIIHGALSIPEPGKSPEYSGTIALSIPKLKLNAAVAMKLAPRYPAFYIEASVGLPTPIPLGPIALYEFGGLVGYRYVIEKSAVKNLSSDATWYEFYTAPKRGVGMDKFTLPNKTAGYAFPFSLGAGTVLGTSFDMGTTFSARVMMILSLPGVFIIDGRADLLSKRVKMMDNTEPPFFAMLAWGDDAIEVAFGADFKLPKNSGSVVSLNANMQARFPKRNPKDWYIHAGTREKPLEAVIFKDIFNLRANAFLMLSSKGLELGAKASFSFDKRLFGIRVKVSAYASVELKISFGRIQFGGSIGLGGSIEVNVWRLIMVHFSLDTYLGVEAPKPFLINAEVYVRGKIKVLFVKISFSLTIRLRWEISNELDISPIIPLPYDKATELVQGVHMLTNDVYKLELFNENNLVAGHPDISKIAQVIPVDTYIDFKAEKALCPTKEVNKLIGGAIASSENVEAFPPMDQAKGRPIRQVVHTYSVEGVQIYSYLDNENKSENISTGWYAYHPYKALLPKDYQGDTTNLKLGYWQITGTRNDYMRLLSDFPFDFLKQLQPNAHPVEDGGLIGGDIVNPPKRKEADIMNVLNKELGKRYAFSQNAHFINGIYFRIPNYFENPNIKASDTVPFNTLSVTKLQNSYSYKKSLTFSSYNKLQIDLPETCMEVDIKLSSTLNSVIVRFYEAKVDINDKTQASSDVYYNEVLSKTLKTSDINSIITYDVPLSTRKPISRIVIEAEDASLFNDIIDIQNKMARLFSDTYATVPEGISVIIPKDVKTFAELQSKLNGISRTASAYIGNGCEVMNVCELFYDLAKNSYPAEVVSVSQIDISKVAAFVNKINNAGLVSKLSPYYEQYVKAQAALNTLSGETEALANYGLVNAAAYQMMQIIYSLGRCNENVNYETSWLSISIQEIKWLSLSKWNYNNTIPENPPVTPDVKQTIRDFIHPVWRPNTAYHIRFILKDLVSWRGGNKTYLFNYDYGFKTSAVVGHFTEKEKTDNSAMALLNNLQPYLDFNRSYPNADSDLLMSKPLFAEGLIELFFKESYVSQLLQSWVANNEFNLKSGMLKLKMKDSVGVDISNEDISVIWDDGNIPLNSGQQYLDKFKNDTSGTNSPVVPYCKVPKFSVKNLKPQQLYTAVLHNEYQDTSKEIHRFSFMTSRYGSFLEQVESYKLKDDENQMKPAVYHMALNLDLPQVDKAYTIVSGENLDIDTELSIKFPHAFDRVISGLFLLKPLNSVETTEFNLIYNQTDNKLIAILIRNPEPFNNPRMPLKDISDSILVLKDDNTKDANFCTLHSKDYSQVIIMKKGNDIVGESLKFSFIYKGWCETNKNYIEKEKVGPFSIELIDDIQKGIEFWALEESFIVQ